MQECKQQILNTIPNNNCCSFAFLNVVALSSQINKDFSNLIVTSQPYVLEKVIKVVTNFYPNIEINCWDSFLLLKGNIYEFLVDLNFKTKLDLTLFDGECDKLTLLKSFFLMNGRFYYNQDNNKNSKGYNLEFVLKDEHTANVVLELLKLHNFELKKIKRQSNYVIYTKNSNIISDLLVLLGATYTALEIQNSLAIREMRNNVNRQNNCFESNLEKTLDASTAQLKAINYIVDNYSIDYLQENLREVALARIANPDVSLNELRTLLGNNISRAGIKYRLDKIIEIYNNLKGEK
ncbi:MAG: DNA-binding protein WhiA [Clostridia bacterium]|nr:DNA-binding protein WhiA [Clostridia bacterium]